MPTNPFDILPTPIDTKATSNPFNNLEGKNYAGQVSIPDTGPTHFALGEAAKADATISTAESNKQNSIYHKYIEPIISPIQEAKGAFQIAKTAVTHPIDSAENTLKFAQQAALGFTNGVTLGASDYVLGKAFVNKAKSLGMNEEEAQTFADNTLHPNDFYSHGIRNISDFAGIVVPYEALEKTLIKGAAYAAPEFVTKYARASKLLVDIGVFNAAGQIDESFKPADQRNRLQRAVIDTGTAVGINAIGGIYRAVRKTPFASPFAVNLVENTNSLVQRGVTVSADTLKEGALKEIERLSQPENFRGAEDSARLKFLKENVDNPDKLYEYNSNPPKLNVPVPDAKASVTIGTGEVDPKTGETSGPKINVATNDLPALQDYIKGSGDINYKVVDSLGKDAKGNEIQARHEFNADTGVHTIYTTDATTASSLAHELGHYFDTKLTNTTEKLSTLISGFDKNRQKIEDILGSIAVERLGGNATSEQISKEISSMVPELQKEVDTLSSIRRGKLIASKSERFADAVSQVAVESGAKEKAPILTSLLKQGERFKDTKLFGEAAIKDLTLTGDKAKDVTVTVAGKDFTMTGKAADGVKVATEDYRAKVKDSYGIETKAAKKEFQAAKEKIVKEAAHGEANATKTKIVKEAPTLDRGETGKVPNTPAFRAELITKSDDLETFINTKILSKMEGGTERISKSNKDIIDQAMKSSFTEADFNKILDTRLGNIEADTLKGKQFLVDGANNYKNMLAGRDLESLTGQEKKDIMAQAAQTMQTFQTFSGLRTAYSNVFRTLGIGVTPGENDALDAALQSMQKALGMETNPFEIAKGLVKIQQKDVVAKYFQVWYPSLLMGEKTAIKNPLGSFISLAAQVTSRLFTKEGRQEFMPMLEAIINGNKKAWNKAIDELSGKTSLISKFEELPIPNDKIFGDGKLAFLNKLELVGRFFNAQDVYFKSLAKDADIAAQRVGKMSGYGIEDEGIAKAIEEARANNFANKVTFRGAYEYTTLQTFAKHLADIKQNGNAFTRTFTGIFFPFIKTSAKITDSQIDFIPFLNFARSFDTKGANKLFDDSASRILKDSSLFNKLFESGISKDMTAEEARSFAQSETNRVKQILVDRLKDEQRGRLFMGMTVTAAALPLMLTGRITGSGPSDKNERNTLMLSGWRPNSIILPGGLALPYQNLLLPLAGILSVMGNMSDAYKYKTSDKGVGKIGDGLRGFMQSELDNSFLTGLSSIMDLLTGYKSFSETTAKMVADGIPIPAFWTQTKDIAFPGRFNPNEGQLLGSEFLGTLSGNVKNKLGITDDFFNTGLTTPLQPQIDAFGNQQKADLIYGLTPPIFNSKTNDPVLNFMLDNNISVGKPNMGNKIQGSGGKSRPMTADEYTQYAKESGTKVYDELNQKIQSGYFDRYKTEDDKKKAMNSIVKEIRLREKNKINY